MFQLLKTGSFITQCCSPRTIHLKSSTPTLFPPSTKPGGRCEPLLLTSARYCLHNRPVQKVMTYCVDQFLCAGCECGQRTDHQSSQRSTRVLWDVPKPSGKVVLFRNHKNLANGTVSSRRMGVTSEAHCVSALPTSSAILLRKHLWNDSFLSGNCENKSNLKSWSSSSSKGWIISWKEPFSTTKFTEPKVAAVRFCCLSLVVISPLELYLLFFAADRFWYCRLSPNHKVFYYGDCESDNSAPSIEQLPNKREPCSGYSKLHP